MSELKQLIEGLSTSQIIKIMEELGASHYQETNNAIIFPTLCHNIDEDNSSMKLYYYPKTKTFHCYTECGCTFNIIEMLKKRYELLNIDYNFYNDIVKKLGGEYKKPKQEFIQPYTSLYKKDKEINEVSIKPLNKGLLNIFTFYPTVEWLNDGISVEAMKTYNILYSITENKIIIPHYDLNGELIGIRGRALNEEDLILGKYMPVKIENITYAHPLGYNLYGLNFVKENVKKYKTAIIAEGEKSCLQYSTMFGQDRNIVVATCGSSFHKYQLDLLLSCGVERVLIAFDNEGETWEEKERYWKKIKGICEKYKSFCTMGYVIDTQGLLQLKQSPFDCGKNVAEKLISKGVWI